MTKKSSLKKPVSDWHNADVVAALWKAGLSLRQLSLQSGYKSPNSLSRVLQVRWPKGQRLIAEALGKRPEEIWPSRYATSIPKEPKRVAYARTSEGPSSGLEFLDEV